jgi:hypothetical protein
MVRPPRAIEQLAHDVGLPIDSPDLHDAKDEMARLRRSLAGAPPAVVARELAAAQKDLARLGESDRHDLEVKDGPVLGEAEALVLDDEPGTVAPPVNDPGRTDPPAAAPATTAPPATDPAMTAPPATDPATTAPPATDPATTAPLATDPPTTAPPP